jgi:hypothetical protein
MIYKSDSITQLVKTNLIEKNATYTKGRGPSFLVTHCGNNYSPKEISTCCMKHKGISIQCLENRTTSYNKCIHQFFCLYVDPHNLI